MYTRPTIFWNLTCELRDEDSITRKDAAQVFESAGVTMKVPIFLVCIASIFGAVALFTMLINVIQWKNDNQERVYSTTLFRLAVFVIVTIFSFVLFTNAYKQSKEAVENSDSLASMQECSDD